MNIHNALSICLVVLCLCALPDAGAVDVNRFQYYREILTVAEREEIAAIQLDSAMWNHLQTGASDLRITDTRGLEIPFILRKAARREMRTELVACKSEISRFQHISDDQAEILLTLATNTPFAHEIVLSTPLRDYEKRISVWGVHPDGSTEKLVEDALIYDYSRFADVRHNTVDIPENTFRQFKILVDSVLDKTQSPQSQITRTFEDTREVRVSDQTTVTTRPFRIDQVVFNHRRQVEKRSNPHEMAYTPRSWQVEQDSRNKSTIIDIATWNEPLHALEIQAEEKNFSRTVVVEIPVKDSGRERWREIARGPIAQISFRAFNRRELKVSFPERQSRRYRVTIDDLDGPPLTITDVLCHGPVWQAVFLAVPDQTYRVHYGAPGIRAAKYDTDHIRRVLEKDYLPAEFYMDEVVENQAFVKSPDKWRAFFSSKTFFIAVVILMVVVLGFGLARAGKTAVDI